MSMNVKELLGFRQMITPLIIQVLFWIGVVVCVIAGLSSIVGGAASQYGGGGRVLAGVLTLLLGPLVVRVYCELLIVLFRVRDLLEDIKSNTAKPGADTTPMAK